MRPVCAIFRALTALLLALATALSTAGTASPTSWWLMSRHGECTEPSTLERKIPELGSIESPHAFARLMEEKGHKVILNELTQGQAFQVSVPDKELNLLFVNGSICTEFISG